MDVGSLLGSISYVCSLLLHNTFEHAFSMWMEVAVGEGPLFVDVGSVCDNLGAGIE